MKKKVFLGALALVFAAGVPQLFYRVPSRAPTARPVGPSKIINKAHDTDRPSLQQLVRTDNLCGYLRWREKGPANPAEQVDRYPGQALAALLVLPGTAPQSALSPCLQALYTPSPAVALQLTNATDLPACRFLSALLLGDFFFFPFPAGERIPGPQEEKKKRALELLRHLQRNHPENGIYALAQLPLLRSQQRPSEELETALLSFLRSQKVESPLRDLHIQLLRLGLAHPTAYAVATTLSENGRVLDLSAAKHIVLELLDNRSFAAEGVHWANRFSQQLDALEQIAPREPFVDTLEVSDLQDLAEKIWQKHFPAQPVPERISGRRWRPLHAQALGHSPLESLEQVTRNGRRPCGPSLRQDIKDLIEKRRVEALPSHTRHKTKKEV